MAQDFLVEIGTEELPPKALKNLAVAFHDGIVNGLQQRDLHFANSEWFASPRRLAVRITQLNEQAPDKELEIHGPPVQAAKDKDGNWTKAAEGFAKKNNVSPEQLEELDTPKGPRLGIKTVAKGETAEEVVAHIVETSLEQLPIPKRMRWGASRAEFIRPVHWIVMVYGSKVIPATILGITATNETRGHRFHCNTSLPINSIQKYEEELQAAHVIAGFERRKQMIRSQLDEIGTALNANVVIDEDLLDEVTSLVEWPVAMSGRFEDEFLSVPKEALISTMKENQKYFHVENDNGELLPYFITISNIQSNDPQQVIAGNERVVRPRLSDAKFFFETDKNTPLVDRVEKLKTIVFQKQLGTLYEKAKRVEALAGFIADAIDSNVTKAKRAGLLAKADLVSDMVLEFDTMQGIAGYYYALNDGEPQEVAEAIKDQYLPRFAGDALPASNTGCALALADRIDTLVGIFGIGQPPTGSKDPFALRRASLGVLRILVEKELALDLQPLLEKAQSLHAKLTNQQVVAEVLAYMIERFRAWYEEADIPVQVFQAVSAKQITQPLDFDARVKAVHAFNQLTEATALAAANKRVSNILAKYEGSIPTTVDSKLLSEAAEKTLFAAVQEQQSNVEPLFANSQYTDGLSSLASLREAVDNFFDNVMVMADDDAVKQNRVALLQQLRQLFLHVADISLLAAVN